MMPITLTLAGLLLASDPASTLATDAESFAAFAGRLLGAAEACGADPDRLAGTAEAVRGIFGDLTREGDEIDRAERLFATSAAAGSTAVADQAVPCDRAVAALVRLEKRIAPRDPPALSGD